MASWREAVKQAQASTVDAIGAEPETMLRLEVIRLDGGTQPRAEIADYLVSDYAEEMERGVRFPAVTVFYDGSDYWLADGFHRFHATKRAGRAEISADVRQGTRRDAVLYSVGANASHGKRRNNSDKRRAVETLLRDEEWAKWSDRKIAALCQVSAPLVGTLRATVTVKIYSEPAPVERHYVNRYGQESVMDTSRIGKPPETPQSWEGLSGDEIVRREAEDLVALGLPVEVPPAPKYSPPAHNYSAPRIIPHPLPDTPETRASLAGRIENFRAQLAKKDIAGDYGQVYGRFCEIQTLLKRAGLTWVDFIAVQELREIEDALEDRRATHNLIHHGAKRTTNWTPEEKLNLFVNLGLELAAGEIDGALAKRLRETCETILELIGPNKRVKKEGTATRHGSKRKRVARKEGTAKGATI